MLGNGLHVLGKGPHLCSQFMNTGLFLLWRGYAGMFVYIGHNGLGNGLHVLYKKSIIKKIPYKNSFYKIRVYKKVLKKLSKKIY